jgi:hypothetical protein
MANQTFLLMKPRHYYIACAGLSAAFMFGLTPLAMLGNIEWKSIAVLAAFSYLS